MVDRLVKSLGQNLSVETLHFAQKSLGRIGAHPFTPPQLKEKLVKFTYYLYDGPPPKIPRDSSKVFALEVTSDSPSASDSCYSEDYIEDVIYRSLRNSGLQKKYKMNKYKSAATSPTTAGHSPMLFSARQQPDSAPTNATITLVSTQSASSTSSSEDIVTSSNRSKPMSSPN